MSAKDLIVKWEEALQGALEREPLKLELSVEDLELTEAMPRVRSEIRAGKTGIFDSWSTGCCG
jgi:hypothetical protein